MWTFASRGALRNTCLSFEILLPDELDHPFGPAFALSNFRSEVPVAKTVLKKSILELIKIDHRLLRESIPVLKSEDALASEKKKQLERFLFNLSVHAKTEEKTLYNALNDLKALRPMILEGYEEHNIADHLSVELTALTAFSVWSDETEAKAKVLAELIEHHLDEEESELFPKIKTYLTKTELENLGVIYLTIRKDLRRELENRFTLPSLTMAALAGRVSSFVSSKFSVSR